MRTDCFTDIRIDHPRIASLYVKPRKSFDYLYQRFIEIVEPKDLMKNQSLGSKPKIREGNAKDYTNCFSKLQKEP